jgi:anti-sigma B factor antagonist
MRRNDNSRFMSAESVPEGVVLHFVQPSIALDDSNTPRMSELLTHCIEGKEAGHLIIELGNVEYVSSLALGIFVRLHKQMVAHGGRLILRNLRDTVYEVFETTQLTRILDIHEGRPRECDGGRPSAPLTSRPPAS